MVGAIALLAGLAAGAGPAGAALESCAYDPVTKRITAEINSGSEATVKVRSNGELWFGLSPTACGGATTANTDLITVNGTAGTVEKLTVDMSEGFIGPGFSSESNLPEIEFAVNLGDTSDTFRVIGTNNGDRMAAGLAGFGFNSDGDLDVTFTPLPSHMTIVGGAGANFLTARGGWGAGLAYPGNTTITGGGAGDELNGGNGNDTITGGSGNDVINGYGANDTLDGGAGSDRVSGGDGDDTITGGRGADDLIAGAGTDTIFANDAETDIQIHGGQGTDTATVDANLDPATVAVENRILDTGPPPPPPPPTGACSYNAATKSVTAGVGVGSTATLAVAGSEIRFGATPVACGAATTANTESITINGAVGSVERLIVDQSGGPLAPGASAESNGIAEIEVAINLGDATDEFTFRSTAAPDALAIGNKGLSFNTDTDVDVTFTPMPLSVELIGGGGGDVLTARGGYGSGQLFAGRVTLRAGATGDTLTGSDLADLIVGGPGADTASGYGGNDEIRGEGGNDDLSGGDGNDLLNGGPGVDLLSGGNDNDLLEAADGEADSALAGGAGTDTASYDSALDATRTGIEILQPTIPPPPPPPPPGGACVYDAATKAVTASLAPGASATLAVVGGEIRFGATPVACGGATTTNTDSIKVVGAPGSVERVVLDQSGGAFAPGAEIEPSPTEPARISEIEIALLLGDAADQIVVIGTAGDDTLAIGTNGIALNGDMDVDVTLNVRPAHVELIGGGGRNVLNAFGGFGANTNQSTRVTLRAGDQGDELTGSKFDDLVVGGAGADVITGGTGNDEIRGGGGADNLSGNDGNDLIVGGAGADTFAGGPDNDTLDAADGQADAQIHGAQGVDRAFYDAGLDPAPVAVEIVTPGPPGLARLE